MVFMKTMMMVCVMALSMAGESALFAQTAEKVIFRVTGIPASQGKILLTTKSDKYCCMADVMSQTMELKIEDMPNGEYTVYAFHDANSNGTLDKDENQIPVEHCAIQKIQVTEQEKAFLIVLKDIQKQVKDQ